MNRILVLLFILTPSFAFAQEAASQKEPYFCLEDLFYGSFPKLDTLRFERKLGVSPREVLKEVRKNSSMVSMTTEQITYTLENLYFQEPLLMLCLRDLLYQEILERRFARTNDNYPVLIRNLQEKLDLVDDYINMVSEINYVQYRPQQSGDTWLKSIHVYHENDIFFFPGRNLDRDYTGGFRFEFMTDQFKMRLFKNWGNTPRTLSYQSILLGGEGYTPYIRFTKEELEDRGVLYAIDSATMFFTDPSLDSIQNHMRANQRYTDRLFASFQYLARGKYRIWDNGLARMQSFFKFGIVGGQVGKDIQSVIHQDFDSDAQRVLNWEDQIGSGGRFALNVEHKLDLALLASQDLSVFGSNPKAKNFLERLPTDLNIYAPFEVAFGTVNTHVGTGIGIMNKSFREVSGTNVPQLVVDRTFCPSRRIWESSTVGLEYNYRYVIHNSMLEGVGFTEPFEDDLLDDEAVTVYRLDEQHVTRHLHRLTLHLAYRVDKISIFYHQTRFLNKEFEVKDRTPLYEEFATPDFYGYGRIGLNFLL
ncbi:MAG TPA: hypothetical protein DCR93_06625 [Cytophagales bacterium]|nr:hypothetical protein [Cytophagales bacterium]